MKKELRDKLVAAFPGLFRDGHQICFECGSGWYGLLHKLFTRLTEANIPADFKIVTVKQKYARLNVWGYSDLEPKTSWWVNELIREYEDESWNVCEHCGSTKNVRTFEHQGWEQTGCRPCREKVMNGWEEGDSESEYTGAVEAMFGRLQDKLNKEVGNLFPPGTKVKMILRNHPGNSTIVVKTPDGQVVGL